MCQLTQPVLSPRPSPPPETYHRYLRYSCVRPSPAHPVSHLQYPIHLFFYASIHHRHRPNLLHRPLLVCLLAAIITLTLAPLVFVCLSYLFGLACCVISVVSPSRWSCSSPLSLHCSSLLLLLTSYSSFTHSPHGFVVCVLR